jgi:hypothetical protein
MKMQCYLAMTAAEAENTRPLPEHTAWMACHFSCYGLGLSNLPRALPEGSMVILNDRTPILRHDPQYILTQLQELIKHLKPKYILLDLQRPGQDESLQLAQLLCRQLPCPVGVSQTYAQGLCCPVFLSAPPLETPLKEYLRPWKDRRIWLEAATDSQTVTVTKNGSFFEAAPFAPLTEPSFCDESLHCSYHISCNVDSAVFTLQRDREQVAALLADAQSLGVELAVGLYQQLG